jgi:hypothetical protein
MAALSFRRRRKLSRGQQPGNIKLLGQCPHLVFRREGGQVGQYVEYPVIFHRHCL